MKKKSKYTHENFDGIIVEDFLPPPNKINFDSPKFELKLSLNARTLNFLKQLAKRKKTNPQKLIQKILDHYTQEFSESLL